MDRHWPDLCFPGQDTVNKPPAATYTETTRPGEVLSSHQHKCIINHPQNCVTSRLGFVWPLCLFVFGLTLHCETFSGFLKGWTRNTILLKELTLGYTGWTTLFSRYKSFIRSTAAWIISKYPLWVSPRSHLLYCLGCFHMGLIFPERLFSILNLLSCKDLLIDWLSYKWKHIFNWHWVEPIRPTRPNGPLTVNRAAPHCTHS